MVHAYDKGISPHEFRKTKSDDLNFIMDYKDAQAESQKEKQEEQAHEEKIRKAMDGLKQW